MLIKRILPIIMIAFAPFYLYAQVTSSSITGTVRSQTDQQALAGATVTAIHVPSGSKYVTASGGSGLYTLPNVRVGGPYRITVTYVGFAEQAIDNIYASLGNAANADFTMSASGGNLSEVVVSSNVRSSILNPRATGAAATIGREALNRTPTIGRTINDITKYNAYSNGRSFAGQDPRFNNFTVDGSVFNNGFGLGAQAQAGGRTSSGAISLDALEELQINIAPYDVRQSGFVGASINAVTRSGTNDFAGSVFHLWNNRDLAGDKAAGNAIPATPFNVKTTGFRLGGPIIKNKLFFFVNGEFTNSTRPALDWVSNKSGAVGNVSRTTEADLLDLKQFMSTNFGWDMGATDNFNSESFSHKYLARIDYNISDMHKLSVRYSHHDSESDALVSNSSSGNTAGNGNRQNLQLALSGQNTGYKQQDNTRSIVVELTSNLKNRISNQFLATYNKQIENRAYRTGVFPTIDILKDGSTYTSLGFDPFTPNNKLDYSTLNITNNTTIVRGKHNITVGASFETFKSNNLFFYASNGVWVFDSIAAFKQAALAYKANPNLAVSPVGINRFNYRYTLLPEGELPWQVFKSQTWSLYAQDEYRVTRKLRITGGVRLDYIHITNTATTYGNSYVKDSLTFKTPEGANYQVNTAEMPKSRMYVSPRLGFNYDVLGNRKTQLRGGTGIFLSRMPYVLLSNQLGNNGVNIGLINATGSTALNYPFTLDPTHYTPTNVNVNALRGYNVNYGDPNLKFPQTWKSNIAIDQRLPFGDLVGTIEFIYNKNINALNYVDVNLKTPSGKLASGADTRNFYPALDSTGPAATNARFINPGVGNVYVLSNNNEGYNYSLTAKLEKPITKNWGGLLAYTYAKATDLSFVASTVNANVPSIYGVNYLRNSFGDNDLRHRFVGTISYRILYGNKIGGGTTVTLGIVSNSGSKISYTGSNDINGDGQINDLIYVPQAGSNLTFQDYITSGVTFTAAQQQSAFDSYINNHPYLKTRRGTYAERNGGAFPWLTRLDFSAEQDLIVKVGKNKKPNTFRFRADILNFGNLINNKWGVGNALTTSQPLNYRGRTAQGEPIYRLATQVVDGTTVLLQDAFVKSRTIDDVYQIQLSVRYIFNN